MRRGQTVLPPKPCLAHCNGTSRDRPRTMRALSWAGQNSPWHMLPRAAPARACARAAAEAALPSVALHRWERGPLPSAPLRLTAAAPLPVVQPGAPAHPAGTAHRRGVDPSPALPGTSFSPPLYGLRGGALPQSASRPSEAASQGQQVGEEHWSSNHLRKSSVQNLACAHHSRSSPDLHSKCSTLTSALP